MFEWEYFSCPEAIPIDKWREVNLDEHFTFFWLSIVNIFFGISHKCWIEIISLQTNFRDDKELTTEHELIAKAKGILVRGELLPHWSD